MRVARFEAEGRPRLGVAVEDGLADATGWVPDDFSLGDHLGDPRALEPLRELTAAHPDFALDEVRFLPPIRDPRRIVCVGVNYDAHRVETGRAKVDHPTLFVRWPSSLVGHREPMVRPAASVRFDYEGELAVIIGARGRHVPAERALEHVAGYACFNDGSVRDFQRHTSQFTPGKNFDRSGSFGPWMVTADAIPEPAALTLRTRLNGEVVQEASTSDLVFDVPALIAYVSTFTTLEPGDVIATGTPSGVGDRRSPPRYLEPGDVVEVEISGIGALRNPVVDE